ncbi:hypothetical protein SEPCBS119000_004692 [Sporothrix epigloea]|uniref:Uncharacterized protein n=1 Tax=Sporothrix epigloea TaxID=1892477 RepID=A0ABP0DTI2_9PEZI
MDRDNPSASSYLREGAKRVEKMKPTYRPAKTAASHSFAVKTTHGISLAQLQPKFGLRPSSPKDRLSSTDDDISEGDLSPRLASSLLSSGSASTTRRDIRPANHTRSSVLSNKCQSKMSTTSSAPSLAMIVNKSTSGSQSNSTAPKASGQPWRTAISWRPNPSSIQQNLESVLSNDNSNVRRDRSIASTVSTSLSSASHNHNPKRVTFDSSEADDSASCLSASTRATSLCEPDFSLNSQNSHSKFESSKNLSTAMPAPEQISTRSVQTRLTSRTTARSSEIPAERAQQPARWRSRSVGGFDRKSFDPEVVELAQASAQRFRDLYAYVPAEEARHNATKNSGTSTVSEASASADTKKNMQAQLAAHNVALQDQFKLRQQTWDAEKSKLKEDLRAAIDSLGKSQASAENLRREANEQRQRMLALSQENEKLKETQENIKRAQDGALQAWAAADGQELSRLQSDLENALQACQNNEASLEVAHQTISALNKTLDELRVALAEEQETVALFREGKMAFEARCSDLEVKCDNLEGQVVVARSANKELHLLLASQIDDLTATKEALQVRICILEDEGVSRAAATAKAEAAAKSAEDKLAQSAGQFAEDKRALEDRLIAAGLDFTALQTTHLATIEEHEACRERMEKLNAALANKVEEVAILTADLAAANSANTAIHEVVLSHSAALGKARLEGIEAATATATKVSDTLRATIVNLQAEVAELKSKQDTLDSAPASSDTKKTVLQEKDTQLETAYDELCQKYTALQLELEAARGAAAVVVSTGKSEALLNSLECVSERDKEAVGTTQAVQAVPTQELTASLQHIQAAYATSEAEVMALRDQLAKMRGKLANLAATVPNTSSSVTKKSTKGKKDELVIVRSHGDRGRFQVMRKSELHRSRSNSQSSRKTEYDSA